VAFRFKTAIFRAAVTAFYGFGEKVHLLLNSNFPEQQA
jgi:hypothetical protein